MKPPFFLTSLPRSGSTFLANFFTYAGVHCWHEAILGCQDEDDFVRKMTDRESAQMGDSDSGLVFCVDMLRRRFPSSPLVVIERNPFHVMASLSACGATLPPTTLDEYMRVRLTADMRVAFEDLFLTETLRNMWHTLTGLRFDQRRAEMLLNFQIQPELAKYRGLYAAQARLVGAA